MTKGNESAFPVDPYWGLTKREYFAGLAMQNLQNVLLRKSGNALALEMQEAYRCNGPMELIAILACKQADYLIEKLNEEKK
jgi:hypothetical protein